MLVNDLERVKARLCARASHRIPGSGWVRQAAVAIILRQRAVGADVELLMIQRARYESDPWSGHMAFPGGRVEPDDDGPLAGAMRECREEIALDLSSHGDHFGRLSERPAMAKGKIIPMVIFPYLFALYETPPFQLSEEVERVVWIPLGFFLDPQNRDTMSYRRAGVDWKLPCYRYQEHLVWGLSLQMIDEMRARLGEA